MKYIVEDLTDHILCFYTGQITEKVWYTFLTDPRFASRMRPHKIDIEKYVNMIACMIAAVMKHWPLYHIPGYFKRKATTSQAQAIDLFLLMYPTIFVEMLKFQHRDISVIEILGKDLFKSIIEKSILFVEIEIKVPYYSKNKGNLHPDKEQEIHIMTSTKFTLDQIKAIIIDIGTDKIKEITKAIEYERRKPKDVYVNFACRILRRDLDWLKHYSGEFTSVPLARFLGDTVSEYIAKNVEKYPMMDTFGRVIVTSSKKGRPTNKSKGLPTKKMSALAPEGLHSFKL